MNASFHFSSTFSYSLPEDDQTTISVPSTPHQIASPSPSTTAAAAVKLQAAFRGHLVRALVSPIRAVEAEATRYERLIQRQETVDAVRGDERERLRVEEGLMALLLRLDSVPGFYPPLRELRRRVSRRISGLQEILDAVVAAPAVGVVDGIPGSLEELVASGCGPCGEEERGEWEEVACGSRERSFRCWEKLIRGGLI